MAKLSDSLQSRNQVRSSSQEQDIHNKLRKRPRFTESTIMIVLFLCGLLSVFTTIGIVYELGKESLNFFARTLWENANKQLEIPIETTETELRVSRSGAVLKANDLIRIGNNDEKMRIVDIQGDTIIVERGFDNTETLSHPRGQEFFCWPKSNTF